MMRELTHDEIEMVSGSAYPGPPLRQWAFMLPEYPGSPVGTWQRAADNAEDFLEAKPFGAADQPRSYFSVGI
jgi:hypothetical protein